MRNTLEELMYLARLLRRRKKKTYNVSERAGAVLEHFTHTSALDNDRDSESRTSINDTKIRTSHLLLTVDESLTDISKGGETTFNNGDVTAVTIVYDNQKSLADDDIETTLSLTEAPATRSRLLTAASVSTAKSSDALDGTEISQQLTTNNCIATSIDTLPKDADLLGAEQSCQNSRTSPLHLAVEHETCDNKNINNDSCKRKVDVFTTDCSTEDVTDALDDHRLANNLELGCTISPTPVCYVCTPQPFKRLKVSRERGIKSAPCSSDDLKHFGRLSARRSLRSNTARPERSSASLRSNKSSRRFTLNSFSNTLGNLEDIIPSLNASNFSLTDSVKQLMRSNNSLNNNSQYNYANLFDVVPLSCSTPSSSSIRRLSGLYKLRTSKSADPQDTPIKRRRCSERRTSLNSSRYTALPTSCPYFNGGMIGPVTPDDSEAPTWRLWGEEKVEGAVYTVYLKKVRYHHPSRSITQENDEDDISHLEWETVRVWFLKAGTLEKLIESLSSSETGELESTFVSVFLATYRTFASATQVLSLILDRYLALINTNNNDINVPEDLRDEHMKALRQTLQVWLDTYPEDFRTPPQYSSLQQLKDFTSEHLKGSDLDVKVQYKLEKMIKEDKDASLSGVVSCDDVIIHCSSSVNGEQEFVAPCLSGASSIASSLYSSLLSVPTVLCANQLTRMDMVLFRNVICHQCLGSVWGRRDRTPKSGGKGGRGGEAASVTATVDQFNAVSFRVQSTVLLNTEMRASDRAKLLIKWIDIAQELRILKNFSSLKAIIAGLQSNPIYRLKKAWAAVPKEKMEMYEELARIFSEENNRLNQRELLIREGTAKHAQTAHTNDRHLPKVIEKHANNPLAVNHGTIPYLGTFLTDLMMIDTAIPDTVHNGLINFDKKRKEFEILAQIRLLQGAAGAYRIESDPSFEQWWDGILVLDDRESWRLSCVIEPLESNNISNTGTNVSASKAAKKRGNHFGHRKNDSLASTSSGSSSFLDTDSINTSAATHDSPAPAINRKMSTSSTTSSQPSIDASLHSTASTTTTSPSAALTSPDGSNKLDSSSSYPIHQHSNSLSNTSMTSQHSNTSSGQMSINTTPSSTKGGVSNGASPSVNPYITPEFYVIKVSLENSSNESEGVLYKSVLVSNSDRTAGVVKAAMEKHGIDEPVDDYTLAQLLPHGEMILPSAANVYYAISTVHDLNFILRRRRHGDENTIIRRHADKDAKARRKLPV